MYYYAKLVRCSYQICNVIVKFTFVTKLCLLKCFSHHLVIEIGPMWIISSQSHATSLSRFYSTSRSTFDWSCKFITNFAIVKWYADLFHFVYTITCFNRYLFVQLYVLINIWLYYQVVIIFVWRVMYFNECYIVYVSKNIGFCDKLF